MFRSLCRFTSKPTAARSRASANAAVHTLVSTVPAAKKQLPFLNNFGFSFARVWPSFDTKILANVLDLSLPPTANLVAIDIASKNGGNSGDVASILRFMIIHSEEVLKLREDKNNSNPIVVVVRTSLDSENAEASDLVLSTALQQRERFKDITAIVLDARQSAAARSVLKHHKYASKFGDKKQTSTITSSVSETSKTLPTVSVSSEKGKNDDKDLRQSHGTKKITKGTNTAKNVTKTTTVMEPPLKNLTEVVKTVEKKKSNILNPVNVLTKESTKATTKPVENKEDVLIHKDSKKNDAENKSSEGGLVSVSKTSPSGEIKVCPMAFTQTRNNTRESLRKVFQSLLAAPFQPPTHVERALFASYVDKVRLSDLLNLSVYGDGEAYAVYYRLTGAGACRTPLITIAQIIKEECKRKLGDEMETPNPLSSKRVPVLLLLGASFLISEDANLMCNEYQNALQKEMSLFADITVAVVPSCFTEKNVLFALKTAKVESSNDNARCEHERGIGGDDSLLSSTAPRLVDTAPVNVSSPVTTLSEDVMRSVVKNALEEVVLLHEKSTEHLVSTLKKLVAYWSRERVIELMETLQSERGAILDATKELEEVQRQLRETKNLLGELRKQVNEVDDKMKQNCDEEKDVVSSGTSKVIESMRNMELRLTKVLNGVFSKEQYLFDIRKEFESLQKNFQSEMYKTLVKEFKEAQEQQSRDIKIALVENANKSGLQKELTQETLQEFQRYIQTAVENAFKSFDQRPLGEKTEEVLKEKNE